MPSHRVAILIEQIVEALTAAHEAGVLHRDLKPENVMLQSDRQSVKLIDFGIAKIKCSEPGARTHTVTFVGTINYVAPEQLMGQVSAATDIYTLGVMTYEMLAGRRPFDPETPFALYELQKAGKMLPPSRLPPELAHVDRVYSASALFDPQKRQATPKEFARELSAALAMKPPRIRRRWIATAAVGCDNSVSGRRPAQRFGAGAGDPFAEF